MMNDKELAFLIEQESERQKNTINLIASENVCWLDVCKIMGSCLTNKYAEGVPGKRFYAGCEIIDQIESLAQQRCRELYGAAYANVQPHSGTQANMAVYCALLSPGDTILSMDFAAGGHLSHGHKFSIVSSLYKIATYAVDRETEYLDYALVREIALKERPRLIIAGASSYSRLIDYKKMREIADEVGAYLLADMAHIAGIVAAGIIPSPVPYADVVTATTHKTLRGARGAFILSKSEYAEKIERALMPGVQGGPFMHAIAAKALTFWHAQRSYFKEYQEKVICSAKMMSQAFIEEGLRVISGGTDNHLFVVDVAREGKNGADVEKELEKEGIIVNRNAIPFDKLPARLGGGIRIGTPFMVSQGWKEKDFINLVFDIRNVIKKI